MNKKRILLKLTGEIFLAKDGTSTPENVLTIIHQIKELSDSFQFGIVIGGGNFFRGSQHGVKMGIRSPVGHQIGMLATMMNGLMLKDLFEQHGLSAELLCAMPSPEIGKPISQQSINGSLKKGEILIFTGGTGNPFFTTDTTAILRALQIQADEIWKGTSIDGVYSADPKKDASAHKIETLTFEYAIKQHLGIMDLTAYAMAEQHDETIRIFDIFSPNALLKAARDPEFGSTISKGTH
ncbi:MAG TPA: uridine monophosphate kinase [Candidatus Babeliales bacterium]|nr:uridine monophosphate kinase [Candidatus Babeliales bacterium]